MCSNIQYTPVASMSNLHSNSPSKKSSNSKTKNNKNYYKSSRSKSRSNKIKNLRKRTHSSLTSNTSRNQNHNQNNQNNNNNSQNHNNYNNNNNNNNNNNSNNKYSNKYSHSHSHTHSKHNKKRIQIKKGCQHFGPSKEKIIQYKKNLYSDSIDKQLFGVSQLRILLSDEQQPPIDLVIRSNCIPRLIEILSTRKNMNLLFETAWVLTNICSGSHSHTMAVVEANGIECILSLLDLNDIALLEQSIWILGNIAGDGINARDICLNKGVLKRLILLAQQQNKLKTFKTSISPERRQSKNLNNNISEEKSNNNNSNLPLSFQRNFIWTISNLVRGKPQPLWNKVSCVIPIILLYLNNFDLEVLTDTCWALSYLSDGCNEHIQSILDLSLLSQIDISKYLIQFLEKKSMNVLVPALRTCGNIVSGSDQQTQQIIDRGLLNKLLKLLRHSNHSVKKEAIWTVSNITAGNPNQIQLVIDAGLIEPLIDILCNYNSDYDLIKECIWAISNATTGGTTNQLKYLSQYASIGLSRVMCMSHFPNDTKLQLVLLEGLDNLLSFTTLNPIPLEQSPLSIQLFESYNIISYESDTISNTSDDDDEFDTSDFMPNNNNNNNKNYVAYIMEQTEAHRILEKWFYDINQDTDVKHLAQEMYKKYFNVPFQF